jgi:serine/threonine-protein kinase HipA
MNPSFRKEEHVLSIDLYNRQPDMGVVLSTAGFNRLGNRRAKEIIGAVCAAVGEWQTYARPLGLSRQACAEAEHLFRSVST